MAASDSDAMSSLSGTITPLAAIVPRISSSCVIELFNRVATLSPGRNPCAMRALATLLIRSTSCLHVRRRESQMTASASGVRIAWLAMTFGRLSVRTAIMTSIVRVSASLGVEPGMTSPELDIVAHGVLHLIGDIGSQRGKLAGRGAAPQLAGGDAGSFDNQRAGGDHGARFHNGPIEDRRPYADEASVLQLATMQNHAMPDQDIITDQRR